MERTNSKIISAVEHAPQEQNNFLMRWATRILIVALFFAFCGWLDSIKVFSLRQYEIFTEILFQYRWYIFDHTALHQLAQEAIAVAGPNNTQGMIDHIVDSLSVTHSPWINSKSSEWVFNNAGGAMGAMYVIHASITEYLIIFGTPLGTEGHTGLHTADDYFNILVGEQWAFSPGSLEMERYPPGSVHHLPRGTTKQYKMHKGCFALEYARGMFSII